MFKFNPLTNNLDLVNTQNIPTYSTAPSNPLNGQMYIDSTTDSLMMYYDGNWNTLHNLVPGVDYYLLLETGNNILLETGDKIILE